MIFSSVCIASPVYYNGYTPFNPATPSKTPIQSIAPTTCKFGPGTVAFKGGRSGKYCTDGGDKMVCNRDAIGQWGKFFPSDLENGFYSLTSGRSNQLCGDSLLHGVCNCNTLGPWGKFNIQNIGPNIVTIRNGNQEKYCTDDGNRFTCNKGAVGPWETFTWQIL